MRLLLAVPALLFGVYLASMHPTVSPYRDSGDMAAAAVTLGISHPPGYPVYALGGKAWRALLPFGDAAYSLNAWSALAGAAAAGLLMLALARWGAGPAALAAGALFLGLAPAHWALAQVTEMYALNAAFAAALLLCWPVLRSDTRHPILDWRPLILAAFLTGIGLANHQTLVFTVPATLWAFWHAHRRLPSGRAILVISAFSALALTLYLFLPVRSWAEPWLDWGRPRGLAEVLRVITRGDYGGMRLHPEKPFTPDAATLWNTLQVTWQAFFRQAGALGLALCALGLWARRGTGAAQAALIAFVLSGPFFIFLSDLDPAAAETLPILEPHLVLPVVFLALFFAWGVQELAASLPGRAGVLAFLVAAAPVWRARDAHGVLWNRTNFSAEDYGRALLSAMEPGAFIMDPDDPTAFTLSYFKAARGLREDADVVMYFRTRWGYRQLKERRPDLVPPKEAQNADELYSSLLAYNLAAGRAVYADLPVKVKPPFDSFPQGWAYRIQLPGTPSTAARYARAGILWEVSRARPARGDFFTRHTLDYGASAMNNLGVRLLSEGRLDPAEASFKRALAFQPELAEGWTNWGNVLHARKDFGRAAAAYRESLRLKPDPRTVYNLGRALWSSGDLPRAEAAFIEAVKAGGEPSPANDLALLWLGRGEHDRAAKAFAAVLDRFPGYRPARYNLALARYKLGDRKGAAEAMKAYRDTATDPADRADAQAFLNKIESPR